MTAPMTNGTSRAHSVSIIIPTLNEEENIEPLVSRIAACGVPFREIVFVDDHSTDNTQKKIRLLKENHPVRLIEQDEADVGLAGAIMRGARAAHGEILIVMDADLSHPPERINDLLGPLLAGSADMVVGSRYVTGGSTPGWPVWRRIISRAGATLAYPLTALHDSMCGFFAIGRSQLLELAPHASGFKIVFETMVRGRGTLRVREIPIAFHQRVRGTSKMSFGIAVRFFVRWLRAMLEHLVRGTAQTERAGDLGRAAEALHQETPVK
jgi:dolichol-phosphate mannosyltransferase